MYVITVSGKTKGTYRYFKGRLTWSTGYMLGRTLDEATKFKTKLAAEKYIAKVKKQTKARAKYKIAQDLQDKLLKEMPAPLTPHRKKGQDLIEYQNLYNAWLKLHGVWSKAFQKELKKQAKAEMKGYTWELEDKVKIKEVTFTIKDPEPEDTRPIKDVGTIVFPG
jgi:hypothetical protein